MEGFHSPRLKTFFFACKKNFGLLLGLLMLTKLGRPLLIS
jgi:hypothetical protein